ncbi:HTH-type transcriptional activator RhaS [Achromobacter deleyi]|uniref:HTH-type transcriptional activator RhaS n=1 Tax=Achromobacter deleyi TaxID=1353891 RepID=A0A6S7ADD2_9BURK|nr:DJ-1/PfpI family protein [Achromobacter deleyi]CAB3665438.1 HTH-type transcriptional activator RhaS [Achromobacter deleyi]CAB3834187.1 HTH-type transcriptional activator RhaS [Achromobacter deleyi]CAB3854689.1 HTH-type transcriptional activator RhaS [Achromobacter deleyi]CAB3881426.1 HTH-type transcriptional activator RhaS [Achromobacter deleyi]
MPRPSTATPRLIAIVIYPTVQHLDVAGPADVFSMAGALGVDTPYRVVTLSSSGGPVALSNGLALHTEAAGDIDPAQVDTLIIPGGERDGLMQTAADAPLQAWVTRSAAQARRVASVCTGAFLLAHWGLLDGRRVATHWASAHLLAQYFQGLQVEPDALYVQDGSSWTSGGITAGIDMCLAMVEQDAGRWLASRVARQLNLAVRRQGNQAQYSLILEGQAGAYGALVDWLREHLAETISVERMAQAAGQSPRTFHRGLVRETGFTPRAFLEALRLETVRSGLDAGQPVKQLARLAGFHSETQLAKAFQRRFGLSPSQYRTGPA